MNLAEALASISKNYPESPWPISQIELHYNARFVIESSISINGNWTEREFPIFYNANPDHSKGHANYFVLIPQEKGAVISSAEWIKDVVFPAVRSDDGKVYISRSRHDYIRSIDGSVMIDGGRDYCRHTLSKYPLLRLKVQDGEFVLESESCKLATNEEYFE